MSSATPFLCHLPPPFFVHLPPGHLPPPKIISFILEGVVDKEVTKQVEVYKELVMDMVVEEVNRELLKEFNESLVLVCRCGDGLRGDHKVDGGGSGTGQEG